MTEQEDDEDVTWFKWCTSDSTTKKGKDTKRMKKDLKEGCVAQVEELILESWPSYLEHVRTKKIMSVEFQDDLKKENTLILQCDFAMDYNTMHNAKEIQSAIYGRQNITIFTCAIYHEGSWISYSVITDADKYKNTIQVCLLKILRDFVANNDMGEIDKLIIWNDGPSCEFQNQFVTGKVLFELSQVIERVTWWKYFAASHGKGVCDGIGGALKACVAEHAKGKHCDEVAVQSYEDFFHLAKKYCPKVTVFLLSKDEVAETTEQDRPWAYSIPMPGVSNLHVAKCGLGGSIQGWILPGEQLLKPVRYPTSVSLDACHSILPPRPVTEHSADEEIEEDGGSEEPVTVAQETSATTSSAERSWHIITFEDGTCSMNFVCQVIRPSGDKYIVRSYVSVTTCETAREERLFKKYPGITEEVVDSCQFMKQLERPEILNGGRVQFKHALDVNVK